jgi:O-acetyl-ADP-ribose deacetylase (regulator of RNase III)
VVGSLALPGLGTGVGGLSPRVCAQRVAEALDELLG